MALKVEDLDDQSKYRELLKIPYDELIDFVLDYMRRKSELMIFFWSACVIFLGIAITVRINIAGYFPLKSIMFHSLSGFHSFSGINDPATRNSSCNHILSGRSTQNKVRYGPQTIYVLCNGSQICNRSETIQTGCFNSVCHQ